MALLHILGDAVPDGAQIFIEAKSESLIEYHLYLVYRAADGREWVLRGGPPGLLDILGGEFDFEINVPIEDSSDAREGETPTDRHSTLLVFGGQSVDETWNLMVAYAQKIDATGLPYHVLIQNSNTFVAALIEAAGRDPAGSLPAGLISAQALGYSNYLEMMGLVSPPEDGIFRGTGGSDLPLGMQTAQTMYGYGGADFLDGGQGNDVLFGGGDNDILQGGAGNDSLEGGAGNDKLRGEAGTDLAKGGHGRDTLVSGGGGDTLFGNGDGVSYAVGEDRSDADIFILTDADRLDASVGKPVHIKDYNQGVTDGNSFFAGEGDRIDISQILSSGGGSLAIGQVRAVADPSGAYALFQINPSGVGQEGDWISLARLDGLSAGQEVLVQLTASGATDYVTIGPAPIVGGSGDGFDFPMGALGADGRRSATPAFDGDGSYVANEFGEYYDVSNSPRDYHLGEDWNFEDGDDTGAPVYSAAAGVVVFAGDGGTGWGNVVIIRHPLATGEYGGYVTSLYGHLGELSVTVDQIITRGMQIGVIGAPDGPSTGAHLHFEIRSGEDAATALSVGAGYSETPQPAGWLDPTEFILSHRSVGLAPALKDWWIAPSSISVNEANTSIAFTINRAVTSTAETIYVSTTISHGSYNDDDYDGRRDVPVTFAAGVGSQTFTVDINDDGDDEATETFGLIVQRSSTDPISSPLAAATFSIIDDDAAEVDPGSGVSFNGTNVDDDWSGTAGHDSASGNGGDDILRGYAGNDSLTAGPGNDYLSGGDDDDQLSSNGGTDTLLGGAGDDTIEVSGSGA
ncbi:MAG: peptidoglycan DD-metalloendopeptidase family protein, partial [Reyranella sp.]|nr:peptidoglycan DD-metalloendopeptidase family protein [Reyranella sp.]